MYNLILFIRLSRPAFLVGVFLLYALGGGIAHYLGQQIDWSIYFAGQIWVTLLQLSAQYLNEFFDSVADQKNENRTILTGGSGALGPGRLDEKVALYAAFTCLAGVASITILMIATFQLPWLILLIMAIAIMVSIFYSTPPLRLEGSGYGELLVTFTVACLVPTFSFFLQTGELHRLLAMVVFPISALMLAMLLAFELPDYLIDIKSEKRTIMVRVGWNSGMVLHNILILSAYLFLGLAALRGLPISIWLPSFFTLPIALLQIWQMRRISGGAKPNWNSLVITAALLFTGTTYFMSYAFWTN